MKLLPSWLFVLLCLCAGILVIAGFLYGLATVWTFVAAHSNNFFGFVAVVSVLVALAFLPFAGGVHQEKPIHRQRQRE